MDLAWLKNAREQYGRGASLLLAFLLIGVLSFEAGALMSVTTTKSPLIIRTPEAVPAAQPVTKSSPSLAPTESPSRRTLDGVSPQTTPRCAFVGSKNSNKYHLPTSRCAKQIKSENLVCFESAEGALKRGYQPGCLE